MFSSALREASTPPLPPPHHPTTAPPSGFSREAAPLSSARVSGQHLGHDTKICFAIQYSKGHTRRNTHTLHAIVTCVSTDERALVEVVTAAHAPSLVIGAKHLQADTESMLDHTILTTAFRAPTPWTTFIQPVKMLFGHCTKQSGSIFVMFPSTTLI